MYHTHLTLCAPCVYFAQKMKMHQKISNSSAYLDQVRLHNCRVHVRAVPISLQYEDTTPLLCVRTVSVLLKT